MAVWWMQARSSSADRPWKVGLGARCLHPTPLAPGQQQQALHSQACGCELSASAAGVGLAAAGLGVQVCAVAGTSGVSVWPLGLLGQQGQACSAPGALGVKAAPPLLQRERSCRAGVPGTGASAAVEAAVVGWGAGRLVVHFWCHGRNWMPSAAVARGRGAVSVLAAEVGPRLRLLRLLGYSRGRQGWLLQDNSLNSS